MGRHRRTRRRRIGGDDANGGRVDIDIDIDIDNDDDEYDDDEGRAWVTNNDELRKRDMGRIAAIVFDHAYHHRTRRRRIGGNDANGGRVDIDIDVDDDEYDDDDARHHPRHRRSAFSDPVAMEQLCGALATNAISAGLFALRHPIGWYRASTTSRPCRSLSCCVTSAPRRPTTEDPSRRRRVVCRRARSNRSGNLCRAYSAMPSARY